MKYFYLLNFLLWSLFSTAQIPIVGKIIPWKNMDPYIEAFEIVVTFDNDTILNEIYSKASIGKPGQFTKELFKINCPQKHGQLKSTIRFGKSGQRENWTRESHEVNVRGRELYIEIEYHFQVYENDAEFLSEFTFKKIYKLPETLLLKSVWDYKIESTPRYIISNNSDFLLYGQSGDGYCEGKLFKKGENGEYERYYTGGYDLSGIAECPLYNESELVSTIRNESRSKNRFLMTEPGHYLYTVRLGFAPYELSSEYGRKPFYSAEQSNVSETNKIKLIKEYFELKDEFEIKEP